MTKEQFKQRLSQIKKDYQTLETKLNKVLDNLSILYDDLSGVYQSWLSDLLDNHLITLFLAVNPKAKVSKIKDDVDYYRWEEDFGGEVEVNGTKYNLQNDDELYEYILSL